MDSLEGYQNQKNWRNRNDYLSNIYWSKWDNISGRYQSQNDNQYISIQAQYSLKSWRLEQ